MSHKDFTNLISLLFAKQASHHKAECLGMQVDKLENAILFAFMYISGFCKMLGNSEKKSESFLVNLTETKSNFAHAPLMSLQGLHT